MNRIIAIAILLLPMGVSLLAIGQPLPLALSPSEIQALPSVGRVEVRAVAATATRRIIHILDRHLVSDEMWAADLRDQGADEDEIAAGYLEHVGEVAARQERQTEILEALITQHGLRTVYIEGLSQANRAQFERQLRILRSYRSILDPESPLGQFLSVQYELDLLRVGAAGRLAMAGKLELQPAEDAAAYEAANPFVGGRFQFNLKAQVTRDVAVARLLLQGPAIVVVVFGEAHDFGETICRMDSACEYVRVEPRF